MIRRSSRVPCHTYLYILLACASVSTCCGDGDEAVLAGHVQSPLGSHVREGRRLFEEPPPHSNGRSCASCHVPDDDTTLKPANVAERLQTQPDDALFQRLDADDPEAETPTFEHLKKGLVRVELTLADNLDVVDFEGRVVTNAERTIAVWRGVPTVANTAFTAPYQADAREPNLEHQAQSAITSHARGPQLTAAQLHKLASFERSVFSSPRAGFVARLLDLGVPENDVPIPENWYALNEQEMRGQRVYEAACAACHGGATTDRVTRQDVAEALVFERKPDGNVRFAAQDGQNPTPVLGTKPRPELMNLGLGAGTYFGQIGVAQVFNSSVELPRYRLRFYRDGSRREAVVDLPPVPATVSSDPHDPRPATDADGAPIVGPNLIPQQFTSDPGRAAISGDPLDFEAFDVPQLRGIARTAPYFHDNMRETLEEVVDDYSRFMLPLLTPLALPSHAPEREGGLPESLSREEKADLLAFLRRL